MVIETSVFIKSNNSDRSVVDWAALNCINDLQENKLVKRNSEVKEKMTYRFQSHLTVCPIGVLRVKVVRRSWFQENNLLKRDVSSINQQVVFLPLE